MNSRYLKSILIALSLLNIFFLTKGLFAQCCSGGSGNPIGGGTSQGVLSLYQTEINFNFQHLNSNAFLTLDSKADKFLENYASNYGYLRLGYGITSALTLSVEGGYFFDNTEIQLNNADTISTSGIGDLIVFPRYNLFHDKAKFCNTDFVVGIGSKIPVGNYNDSLAYFTNTKTGETFYMKKPPGMQTSSGANDFIFYSFYRHYFSGSSLNFSSSFIHIRKGWNPDGEKLGNFTSMGLFINRNLIKGWSLTAQLRAEIIQQGLRNEELPFPNYIVEYSGGKKIFFAPQINYSTLKGFSFFALTEIPLYQYLNGTQIASKKLFSIGAVYRFTFKSKEN